MSIISGFMDHKQVRGMSDVSVFSSSTAEAATQGGLLLDYLLD